jgi:hypothetical protein
VSQTSRSGLMLAAVVDNRLLRLVEDDTAAVRKFSDRL